MVSLKKIVPGKNVMLLNCHKNSAREQLPSCSKANQVSAPD